MYPRDEPFLRSLECYYGISLLRNSGNKQRNNPLMSAETIRHSSTYTIINVSLSGEIAYPQKICLLMR